MSRPRQERSCPLCGSADGALVVRCPPHLAPDRGRRFPFVRCVECGLVYRTLRPDRATLDTFYGAAYLPHRGPGAWGRWAPVVEGARRRQDRKRVQRSLEALRAAQHHGSAGRPALLRALDVGCGAPTFLARLREETGAFCTGVDTSDRGWRDRPDLARNLDLRVGSVQDVSLDPGFDLVTLWHVLEHVEDPVPLLRRLRSLTSPGAALVVEVPDHASPVRRIQGASWIGYDAPRHAVAYEPPALRRVLSAAGWEVVDLRRDGTMDPWVLWWLGRQVARGRALEGSLEPRFPGFVAGKLLTWPVAALSRWIPLGAMTAVARPMGHLRQDPEAGPSRGSPRHRESQTGIEF